MQYSLKLHTRRSDSVNSWSSYNSQFRKGWSLRYRPFDPFCNREFGYVVTIELELYDDIAAQTAAEAQL